MNIILLSGGSGKRLWPLSNDVRSKQFIQFFRNSSGEYESMVQRVFRQIKTLDPEAEIIIATSKSQVSAIHNQLGLDVNVSVEPCRRDTFPAVALTVAYLHEKKSMDASETVVVCPVDPYVDESYFCCVRELYEIARKGKKKLVLMGIRPTFPTEKYGYIQPIQNADGSQEYVFTEKPSKEKAEEFIRNGALWNGGVFAFQMNYMLKKSKELLGSSEYQYLFDHYTELKKISFDYAVAEQESSIEVLRYSGTWKDLGTWNTLTEAMEESVIGDGMLSGTCENVHVINELGIPVLVMGGKNLVISASPEGILVSDKEQSSYIKPFVDKIDQQIMFAEKSWGSYRVLDVEKESLTVKVTLNPRNRMNYHSHEKRNEIWTVISGNGEIIINDEKRIVKPGDNVIIPATIKHTICAGENVLQLIEVQIGAEISVSDKKKYEIPRELL